MARNKQCYIDGRRWEPTAVINAGSAATGADTTVSHFQVGPYTWTQYNTAANTTRIRPQRVTDANCTDGLELASTNTDNVGGTLTFGGALTDVDTSAPDTFVVGTDPAFFCEIKIGIPDISDYDVFGFGFVEPAAAYVAAIDTTAELVAAYDEKAMIALRDNAGDIGTFTSLAGSDTNTDLAATDWVDDAVKTLRINVSAAGVVTYLINGAADANAVAFTFADATNLKVALIFAKGAAVADTPPIIEYVKFGLQ